MNKNKFILSIFIMGSFGLYVLLQGGQGSSSSNYTAPKVAIKTNTHIKLPASTPTVVNTYVAQTDQTNSTPVKNTPPPTPVPPPVVVPKKTGIYNDGTYTGSVADAYYGNVQVEVTITNGRISDVQFLDYPQDRNTSIRINSRAMPALIQEAISAQSANVNGVSGASDTSAAFKQSLASALNQARS